MSRTCIICGIPARSREHIFPAALGGRRTNKGIYCDKHNNGYSQLAGIITEQLRFFNALLGIKGDHAKTPTSVTMKEVGSGREVVLNAGQMQFKNPQNHFEKIAEGKGASIQSTGVVEKSWCYSDSLHKQIKLGGNEEGMRSIAYIAQTYLAHLFPDIARMTELNGIKDYTLNNVGSDYVWWDFEPPADLPTNYFDFGHRVLIGHNAADGVIYARISFYSVLDFVVYLGNVSIEQSCTVITDINPLAKSPPDDINETRKLGIAIGSISKSSLSITSLSNAIKTGKAKARIGELMRRITDFERNAAADRIMKQIENASCLSDIDRDDFFLQIVLSESQRVYNLMRYCGDSLRQTAKCPEERMFADFIEHASKLDPNTENGISSNASEFVMMICKALANKMRQDYDIGKLDQDHLAMLIGGGPGASVVGDALLEAFIQTLPE